MSLDIGDYVTEAIIDTGSEFTLIKQETAELMRMEVNATKHVPPLQGVTGKKLRVLGSVIANVRVGDQVLNTKEYKGITDSDSPSGPDEAACVATLPLQFLPV